MLVVFPIGHVQRIQKQNEAVLGCRQQTCSFYALFLMPSGLGNALLQTERLLASD